MWDLRLSELLAFKSEHGHCHVAAAAAAAEPPAAAAAAPASSRWAALAAWLGEQQRLHAAGQMHAARAEQLAAIGALPAAAPAAPPAAAAPARQQQAQQQARPAPAQ